MKIVCLIRNKSPLIYFANRINADHSLCEVIVENPGSSDQKTGLFSKIGKHGFRGSLKVLKEKMRSRTDNTADYDRFFGSRWRELDEDLSIVETENINSDVVDKRLKEIKPDLILDHGTSIVKDDILANAPLALNLHWGLSPYYRGTHCTNWALINWDPYNIGVTIHKLTKNIDGGNILAQERAKITSNDTVKSINMQLTYLGTELIVQAINKLKNGKQLGYAGQDFSLGYLFLNRQWNPLLNEYLQQIQQEQVMELMLKKPARSEKLPIVEMK